MKLSSPSKIYITKSKIAHAGRGVFAKEIIKKGEVIETCPVIDLSTYETEAITEGTLITYLFYCGRKKNQAHIAFGFGSIYNNDSKNPNAKYKENHTKQILEFTAIRDIKRDEEITVHYVNDITNKNNLPLWFE